MGAASLEQPVACVVQENILLQLESVALRADLIIPPEPCGLVLFAHGSGSGRRSVRNRFVASSLQSRGLGTLLFDLLTEEEEQVDSYSMHLSFDLPLLTNRLLEVTRWVSGISPELRIGYFGASTGSAAALRAAAQLGTQIGAVVSRGGRTDLAESALRKVCAPTLLMVGSQDLPVVKMNEVGFEQLLCQKQLQTIPGASHLFEETGALDKVSTLAGNWFARHLPSVL